VTGTPSRIWLASFVVVIFVIGMAGGILVDRLIGGPPPPFPPALGPGRAPAPPRPGPLAERLARDLKLTADQRARLEDVFERRRQHMEVLQREMGERFRQEQDTLRAEIGKILNDQQMKQFDDLMKPGRGGPGRHPPEPPRSPPQPPAPDGRL
jgi:hypothetical protein